MALKMKEEELNDVNDERGKGRTDRDAKRARPMLCG